MSVVRETTVFCDVCSDWVRFTGTAKNARKLAALHGWRRKKGQDLCKICVRVSQYKTTDELFDGSSSHP